MSVTVCCWPLISCRTAFSLQLLSSRAIKQQTPKPRFPSQHAMSSIFGGDGTPSSLANEGENPQSSSQSHESGNLPSLVTRPPPPTEDGTTPGEGAPADSLPAEHSTALPSCDPAQVEIDPRGDLTLVVGATRCQSKESSHGPCKTVAFRVCSRAVSRAARAFDTMLFGGFSEAKVPDSGWAVHLPEDDPTAMGMLLQLMHGRFDTFDSSSFDGIDGLSSLYEITSLTDKYDLTHLLRPWAERLGESLKHLVDNIPFSCQNFRALLLASWELGFSDFRIRHATSCMGSGQWPHQSLLLQDPSTPRRKW